MLKRADDLYNHVLEAKDGEIGRCKDFLFDDQFWTVRYMLADTGKWLPGRKVLISPIWLEETDSNSQRIRVDLTRDQIENSPPLDEHAPVSRQYETLYANYFSTFPYWDGANVWGNHPIPSELRASRDKLATEFEGPEESNLRLTREVTGYHIQAVDGEIGHVEDFIVDDETWTIRYMIVDTRNWLPGQKVLVSPTWVNSVDWAEKKAVVELSQEAVKDSPEFNPSAPVDRRYEARLFDFYGLPKYWEYLGPDPPKSALGKQKLPDRKL
jgi:hypothetical protein